MVEQQRLLEVGRVAGLLEADRARPRQRRDEMVGGVVAVEPAPAAMDDQGGMLDSAEQGANVLPHQARPDRADRLGIVAREFAACPIRHVLALGLSGEYVLPGACGEGREILADRGAAR